MRSVLDDLEAEARRVRLTPEQVGAVVDPLEQDRLDAAGFALMEARMYLRRAIARIERREPAIAEHLTRRALRALEAFPRAEALELERDQRRATKLRQTVKERAA